MGKYSTVGKLRTLYPAQWESGVEYGVDWKSKVEGESIVQWESGVHCTVGKWSRVWS